MIAQPPFPYIIAEAGVNHNGSETLALRLVDAAAAAGADAVKFQTISSRDLASSDAPKAAYQEERTGAAENQQDMLQRLELSHDSHRRLIERCQEHGIDFLSTPFDPPSTAFLLETLQLPCIKVSSGNLTDGPHLLRIARAGVAVILSTGMSTLEEIETALAVLAFGYTESTRAPDDGALKAAYASTKGKAALREKVCLLHCTTAYPARHEDIHLHALQTIREAFGLPVGISDHTPGLEVPIAATAFGACLIEKHMTLDKTLPGPDHTASLDPQEFSALVKSVRLTHAALGSPSKQVQDAERSIRDVARKSLVALQPIAAGCRFTEDNLGCKRPGTGISPMQYWSYLGRQASRAYQTDELIQHEDGPSVAES